MISHALTDLAIHDNQPHPTDPSHMTDPHRLIPISMNEARYLIAALILEARPAGRAVLEQVLAWSHWRRRHQAQAQAAHYRRNLAIADC